MLSADDFSIIEEVARNDQSASAAATPAGRPDFAHMEIESLDNKRREYFHQKDGIKIKKLGLELKYARQEIRLRRRLSKSILIYLWAFSAFCAVILLFSGFRVLDFKLSDIVLTTLVGGTAASALGLVSIVLSGIFRFQPKKGIVGKKMKKFSSAKSHKAMQG